MNRIARGLLASAAALSLAGAAAAPASAAVNAAPNRDRYAALGDSFAAGAGGAPLRDAGISYRSADAYPVVLAGRVNKVTFLAVSGADTQSVLLNQVAAVPPTAQQVTLTVGGNDGGAFSQVAQCLGGVQPACAVLTPVDPSSPTAQAQVAGIAALIGAIQQRAPLAHIYVTGYPQLLDTNVAVVNGIPQPTCTIAGTDVGLLASAVDGAIADLNQRIETAVTTAHFYGADAEFVPISFAGHGLCDADSWVYGPGAAAPLHPNADGQQAYAEAVAGAGFVEGR